MAMVKHVAFVFVMVAHPGCIRVVSVHVSSDAVRVLPCHYCAVSLPFRVVPCQSCSVSVRVTSGPPIKRSHSEIVTISG